MVLQCHVSGIAIPVPWYCTGIGALVSKLWPVSYSPVRIVAPNYDLCCKGLKFLVRWGARSGIPIIGTSACQNYPTMSSTLLGGLHNLRCIVRAHSQLHWWHGWAHSCIVVGVPRHSHPSSLNQLTLTAMPGLHIFPYHYQIWPYKLHLCLHLYPSGKSQPFDFADMKVAKAAPFTFWFLGDRIYPKHQKAKIYDGPGGICPFLHLNIKQILWISYKCLFILRYVTIWKLMSRNVS